MRTSQFSIFSSPFSHVAASSLETMRHLCRSNRVENSGVALRGHLRARLLFFTATFLLDFKRDDTMARTRCLVSSSRHLIPSVSLVPFHFSAYLPRSANHISVRRVTCFPVLQQTLHDALQQIYQLVLTCAASPSLAISATFDRMHRSSCARGSLDLVRLLRPPHVAPANSECHVLDCICLRKHIASRRVA